MWWEFSRNEGSFEVFRPLFGTEVTLVFNDTPMGQGRVDEGRDSHTGKIPARPSGEDLREIQPPFTY